MQMSNVDLSQRHVIAISPFSPTASRMNGVPDLSTGAGGSGGLPFTNLAESGLSKKCKKVVHPIVH